LIFLYHCKPCSVDVNDADNGHTAIRMINNAPRRIMKITIAPAPNNAKIATMIVNNGVIANNPSFVNKLGAVCSNGAPVAEEMIHGENTSPALIKISTIPAPAAVTAIRRTSIFTASEPCSERPVIPNLAPHTINPTTAARIVRYPKLPCNTPAAPDARRFAGAAAPVSSGPARFDTFGDGMFNQNVPNVFKIVVVASAADFRTSSKKLFVTFDATRFVPLPIRQIGSMGRHIRTPPTTALNLPSWAPNH